jgi:hypothetical protein
MHDESEVMSWGKREEREVPGFGRVTAPALYHPHRMVGGVFTVDLAAARGRLPAGSLHPVRWGRERAAALVMGTCYSCVTDPTGASPITFGASGFYLLITHGDHDALPYVPLLGLPMPEAFRYGLVTLHMGETARPPIELGRRAFGIPKFLVDLRYEQRGDHDRVVVSDRGEMVWTLSVTTAGTLKPFDEQTPVYADVDGELVAAPMRSAGVQAQGRGAGCATLELGDHPVGDDLRALEPSSEGIGSMFQPYRVSVLAAPDVVGPAEGHVPRWEGSSAEFGRMVVSPQAGLDLEIPFRLQAVSA